MSGALPATVAVEFGFGSAPDVASPTWTDVSAWVQMSPGVTITPGRTAERSGIAPRKLSFTLDNADGRFDPRNASGPYYGVLLPRVPVRVRVTYSAVTYTLFRGFVDGGWPQDFTAATRMVPIEASDAVGWAAQAPPPRSAYEGEITRLQEVEGATLDGWLRPQSDGTWVDMVSGHSFPHSAKFTRGDAGDALVDGDEEGGWGTEDLGGASSPTALVTVPTFTSGSPGLAVLWLRSTGTESIWWMIDGASDDGVGMEITASGVIVVSARVASSGTQRWWTHCTGSTLAGGTLFDGSAHCVAFAAAGTAMGDIWIDGVGQFTVQTWDGQHTADDRVMIGWQDVLGVDQAEPFSGAVDHLTWWTDTGSWSVTVEEAVTRLFDAGRVARAGDSMDARMGWLLEASGWGLVGTLDAASVATEQGYRRRNTVLELLQTIEDTEQGRVWVDNDGQFRFSARSWPTSDTVSATVQATFGDSGTDLPFAAALSRIVDDDRQVVNVAQVTRQYGTQQQAENAASIAAYGRRQPVTLSNLLFSNDKQSRSVAEWLVSTKGEPTPRVEVLTFHPANVPASLVPFACDVEPGWLVRTNRDGQTFDAHVVDVGHQIGPTTWEVSLHMDGTRAQDLTGFTWDDGTSTVGTPWDDGTGTTTGAKGWVF